MLADDLLHTLVEVGLQILIRLHAMRAHERLDLRVRVPLFPVYLIASDMKTLIGKKLGHFADEFIEKMVSMLFCWIHGWIKHSPFALNSIRPGRAGQVGIADKPGGTVARHIEFGSHANASIARVGDHIAHFALRVIQPVGAHLVQLGKFFALDAEALVFRQMPVKNIELHRRHAIKVALDDVERHEVAASVDHQPAPRKARFIVDIDGRRGESCWSGLD